MVFEAGIVGKWLAMLKEIDPDLARVALVDNPKTTVFTYFQSAATAAAPSLGVELIPPEVATASDIERVVESFAGLPHSGLVFPPDSTTVLHRDLVIALAAKHRVPAVYAFRSFVTAGGLMSYTIDFAFEYRQAASYIDRILRGAKPADLPVQALTKFQTVVNLKTAKALGLTVPSGLLVAADKGGHVEDITDRHPTTVDAAVSLELARCRSHRVRGRRGRRSVCGSSSRVLKASTGPTPGMEVSSS